MTRMFRMPRIIQCGDAIFFALALEFFLGGFEVCNPACDFFPLASKIVLRFGHAHPYLSRVPCSLASAIGA